MTKSLIVLLLGVAAAGASMIAFTLGSNSVPKAKEVLHPFANSAVEVAKSSSARDLREQADSSEHIDQLSIPVKPTSERVGRIPRSEKESDPTTSTAEAAPPSPSSNFSSSASVGSPNSAQPPEPASAPLLPIGASIAVPNGGTVPAAMAPNAAKSARTPQQQQMGDQIAGEFLNEVDKPNTSAKKWSDAQKKSDQWYWKMFGSQQANRMGVEAATASLNPEAK